MNNTNKPNIVCIGGGTGTFVVLRGLKYQPCQLSAIVSMSDSGGSNKRIRDEFGLLPTSDIRQCLVALSDENDGIGPLRKLFMYRFKKGNGLFGMTFGNIFMAALADILGSQREAIRQTGKVLRIRGSVFPVTFTKTSLYAQYEDGTVLREEHLIDEPTHDGRIKIDRIFLKPSAKANPEAIDAIHNANLIILGPGDVYTSVIPNLLIDGIRNAILNTKAKKVYIVNLMTKFGQTYNFSAYDHLKVIESYTGIPMDYIIINNGKIPDKALRIYEQSHEQPVIDDIPETFKKTVIRSNIVNYFLVHKAAGDLLKRSLIRHDSKKLAAIIMKLII